MKINENLIRKEVINTNAILVGKVHDVEFDEETYELKSLILRKGGISNSLGISNEENIIPIDLIKSIGDKILLTDAFEDDLVL
ncbi:MAG: PRC-barrel domain-containing protein [Methanobrevibacter sp.]|jgi:sporulation protein YlmC with PRC-barrel domain|nr:PRC-barrel domain-containing protein [Methanobrevibacter sp.]